MTGSIYQDFTIIIEKQGTGYFAKAYTEGAEVVQPFRIPFTPEQGELLLLKMGTGQQGRWRGASDAPSLLAAKEFGGKLFDALFKENIRDLFRDGQGKNRFIRLRLSFNRAPELSILPWEFLYDRTYSRFLALSIESPILRYLEHPEPIEPLLINSTLKMLVVISEPKDLPHLEADLEWKNLSNTLLQLIENNLIQIERLYPPTLSNLQAKLRKNDYNILHFIGHGQFDMERQDGFLFLENHLNHSVRISGQDLGIILRDYRHFLRLVFLNVCEGGKTARNDPFAGVATSILQQGIAAVVAIQSAVLDKVALDFSREFYSFFTTDTPIETCITEARKAMFTYTLGVEWGLPVIYSRVSKGDLFTLNISTAKTTPSVFPIKEPPKSEDTLYSEWDDYFDDESFDELFSYDEGQLYQSNTDKVPKSLPQLIPITNKLSELEGANHTPRLNPNSLPSSPNRINFIALLITSMIIGVSLIVFFLQEPIATFMRSYLSVKIIESNIIDQSILKTPTREPYQSPSKEEMIVWLKGVMEREIPPIQARRSLKNKSIIQHESDWIIQDLTGDGIDDWVVPVPSYSVTNMFYEIYIANPQLKEVWYFQIPILIGYNDNLQQEVMDISGDGVNDLLYRFPTGTLSERGYDWFFVSWSAEDSSYTYKMRDPKCTAFLKLLGANIAFNERYYAQAQAQYETVLDPCETDEPLTTGWSGWEGEEIAIQKIARARVILILLLLNKLNEVDITYNQFMVDFTPNDPYVSPLGEMINTYKSTNDIGQACESFRNHAPEDVIAPLDLLRGHLSMRTFCPFFP